MSTTYKMPTFGEISNIFSSNKDDKEVNVYNTVTWYNQGKTYRNAFQITEFTPEGEGCSMLVIEQRPSTNPNEDSFQVYFNGELQRENFKKDVHKAMMDYMYKQYIETNLPAQGVVEDFREVTMDASEVPNTNPFA